MKYQYILIAALALWSIDASAQCNEKEHFAVKASAEIGLGGAMSTSPKIGMPLNESNSGNYGAEFGYTFFNRNNNSLEVNVGVGYSPTSLKLGFNEGTYSYAASGAADMDGDSYIRHYDIHNLEQKISAGYFTVPVYLTYAYKFNSWVGIHADFGVRLGFKTSAKLNSVTGLAYSYGIYPQYDNLMINEPYLNDFGEMSLADVRRGDVDVNGFAASVLVGVGAEFRIYGPLSLDVSFRYNAGFTNMFRGDYDGERFNATNAPVTYTVAEGSKVAPLTNYLGSSKLNMFGLRLAVVCRF